MTAIKLSDYDQALLSGSEGKAKQIAMKIMLRLAELQGAKEFIDVSSAHIDGCIYLGDASVLFPKKLADEGGRVVVPTTLNAISVDREQWKIYTLDETFAEQASQAAFQYERMGAKPTFSCTPYQLPNAPKFGQHIAWAESNAVVYANSVIGAKTNRYGDFMDICAALTGRAPLSGYHLEENRKGNVLIKLPKFKSVDSLLYPLLGYLIGEKVQNGVPVIEGLDHEPTSDNLKAFGAAIATTGAIGMFHIVGITPEAPTVKEAFGNKKPEKIIEISIEEVESLRRKLSTDNQQTVKMVLLGSPQFSLAEFETLAHLVEGKTCHPNVKMIITTNRHMYEEAQKRGFVSGIKKFGANFVIDSCLCMIEPFIRFELHNKSGAIMTNSGKFAHYGPGLTGDDGVYIASLADCVQSAISGETKISVPEWSYN